MKAQLRRVVVECHPEDLGQGGAETARAPNIAILVKADAEIMGAPLDHSELVGPGEMDGGGKLAGNFAEVDRGVDEGIGVFEIGFQEGRGGFYEVKVLPGGLWLGLGRLPGWE